jgi:hypothetical protein
MSPMHVPQFKDSSHLTVNFSLDYQRFRHCQKVQNPDNSKRYMPLSETFRICVNSSDHKPIICGLNFLNLQFACFSFQFHCCSKQPKVADSLCTDMYQISVSLHGIFWVVLQETRIASEDPSAFFKVQITTNPMELSSP